MQKNTDKQWQELQRILSCYSGEWTSPDYPGAVNPRIPNTALLGNGNIGVSSAGSEHKKSFHISKGDFWEYNNRPLRIGTISVNDPQKRNPAPAESIDFHETEDILHAKSSPVRPSAESRCRSKAGCLPSAIFLS